MVAIVRIAAPSRKVCFLTDFSFIRICSPWATPHDPRGIAQSDFSSDTSKRAGNPPGIRGHVWRMGQRGCGRDRASGAGCGLRGAALRFILAENRGNGVVVELLHDGGQVERGEFAVRVEDLAAHHRERHVVARRRVDEIGEDVVAGDEMHLVEVEQDEIGVHADFDLPALLLAALGARAADRRHHEGGLGRDRGGVARPGLGHERAGLDLLEEVEIVVGGGGVGAERDVHARLHHAHDVGAAARELQVAHGAVDGRDVPFGEQRHVLLRDPHAVGRDAGHVEDVMAVQNLRGREAVFLHALVVLALRLGQVHVHVQAVIERVFTQGVPELVGRGVLRVDGALDFDAAAVVVVPLFPRRDELPAGREGLEVEAVAQKHRGAAREVGLNAGLGHGLGHGVREVVHVRHGGHAEAQTLGDGELRRGLDRARVEMVLAREDVVREPVLQHEIVRVAAQDVHGQVRVAVHEARHQHHAGAVDDLLRLLLGRLFGEPRDLAVRDAHEGVRPDRHPVVHRHNGNMRKQSVHFLRSLLYPDFYSAASAFMPSPGELYGPDPQG